MTASIFVVEIPSKNISLKEYVQQLLKEKGWKQDKLVACARVSQSRLSKIIHGRIRNVDVGTLISMCLALQLNKEQSIILLSLSERTISPVDECRDSYFELIDIYSKKEQVKEGFECFLIEADEFLEARNLKKLPSDLD